MQGKKTGELCRITVELQQDSVGEIAVKHLSIHGGLASGLGVSGLILLTLKILHGLRILQYQNSPGIGYLGSCRIFSIHPKP